MENNHELKKHLIGAIAETMKSKATVDGKLDFDGATMLLSLAFKSVEELQKIARACGLNPPQ